MNTKIAGFSLMEVLIASFIMFISLVVFSSVFRSAIISSDKAVLNVSSAAYTHLIMGEITSQLKDAHHLNQLSGEGSLLQRAFYWQASATESTKPPARYFGQNMSQTDHLVKLWNVELTLTYNEKESNVQYQEVTW
jgi:type II secretory pathway component PulJ